MSRKVVHSAECREIGRACHSYDQRMRFDGVIHCHVDASATSRPSDSYIFQCRQFRIRAAARTAEWARACSFMQSVGKLGFGGSKTGLNPAAAERAFYVAVPAMGSELRVKFTRWQNDLSAQRPDDYIGY